MNQRHQERPADPNAAAHLAGCGAALAPLPGIIGHRGAAARAPENTLAGLRRASELGCRCVEFDVRLTADGAPVLCHDATLDRTTSGHGKVSAQTLAAIRRCDAGAWFAPEFAGEKVPTLDEALSLAAELGLGVNLEIKSDRGREYATAAAVAAALQRQAGQRQAGQRQAGRRQADDAPALLASSFLSAALAALGALAPHIPRGVLFRRVPSDWAAIAARLDCALIGADHRRLRRGRVAEIRAAGYQLAAYTVNDPVRARLLFGWGVTSVFSDAPDIITMVDAGHRQGRQTSVGLHGSAVARQGAMR
jgi:glycerophosphoryl diester phosphodiesterase